MGLDKVSVVRVAEQAHYWTPIISPELSGVLGYVERGMGNSGHHTINPPGWELVHHQRDDRRRNCCHSVFWVSLYGLIHIHWFQSGWVV